MTLLTCALGSTIQIKLTVMVTTLVTVVTVTTTCGTVSPLDKKATVAYTLVMTLLKHVTLMLLPMGQQPTLFMHGQH